MTFSVSRTNLDDLNWSRILLALSDRAATAPGRDALQVLDFLPDPQAIQRTLAEVAELMHPRFTADPLPLDGVHPIRPALDRVTRGMILDAQELRNIAQTASAAHLIRRILLATSSPSSPLATRAQALPDLHTLAEELAATFDDAGQIRDDASPELKAARGHLVTAHRHMKDRLEAFLIRPELEGVLQDSFYTLREDRYVVPVIASFQGKVPGIIHATSNSSETVFIEPGEFVAGNNALKLAEHRVRVELDRVLATRSEWVRAEAPELALALEALIALDLLQARARLAQDLDATIPELSATPAFDLRRARNPHLLLKGAHVVPNDIALRPIEAFVLITGPNTGGKTVTLSTVGTLLLMLWAGCPLPLAEGSTFYPFPALHALIGDAQDLERDLSTFSGHVRALQAILAAARPGSLILLDELAVGTEPQQGAALAIAALEALAHAGAAGLVTTHYERLKLLAFEDPRFVNASVGVDPKTHTPNFQLALGRTGASNPLETAARLGLPASLIERARELAGGHSGLGGALARLEAAERAAEEAQRAAEEARAQAASEAVRLKAERDRLQREARREVGVLTADARREVAALLEDIRAARERIATEREQYADSKHGKEHAIEAKREANRFNAALDTLRQETEEGAASGAVEAADRPRDGGDLALADARPGAAVWVRALGQVGEIVDIRGNRATVAIGALKTQVHIADLGRAAGVRAAGGTVRANASPRGSSPAAGAPQPRLQELAPDAPARVPPPRTDAITVDLRGARRDEVHERVEPALDRAFCGGEEALWIIHGHGSGALRDEVRELLSRSPQVSAFRRGDRFEGGDGVTLAFIARD